MAAPRTESNVLAFPISPSAHLRRQLSFVKNERMLDRWRTDFLKASNKLDADERMALVVAATAKRFGMLLAERGLEPSRKEGC